MPASGKHLYRSRKGMVGGVCAGIADYLGVDPTVVRVIAVILVFASFGAAVFAYLLLMICIPKEPGDYSQYIDVDPLSASSASRPGGERRDYGPQKPCRDQHQDAAGVRPSPDPAAPHPPASDGEVAGEAKASMPGAGYCAAYGAAYDAKGSGSVRDRRNKIVFALGVFLVVFGALNLLNRLLPQVTWTNYWPVLLVIAGIMLSIGTRSHPWSANRFLGGLAVIMLGVVLLGCTTGILGWGVLFSIVSFWPLFAVAAGMLLLSAAFGTSGLRSASAALVLLSLAVGAGGYYLNEAPPAASANASGFDRPGAQQAAASETTADSDADKKVDVSFCESGSFSGCLTGVETHLSGSDDSMVRCSADSRMLDRTSLEMSCGNRTANVYLNENPPASSMSVNGSTSVTMPRQMRWKNISLETMWCDSNIDLEGMSVDGLDIDSHMSDTSVLSGTPSGVSSMAIDARVSNVEVVVPAGVAVSVVCEDASVSVQTDAAFAWDDASGRWCTQGFDAAQESGAPCWLVTVDGCYSNCSVKQAGR